MKLNMSEYVLVSATQIVCSPAWKTHSLFQQIAIEHQSSLSPSPVTPGQLYIRPSKSLKVLKKKGLFFPNLLRSWRVQLFCGMNIGARSSSVNARTVYTSDTLEVGLWALVTSLHTSADATVVAVPWWAVVTWFGALAVAAYVRQGDYTFGSRENCSWSTPETSLSTLM